MTHEEAYKKARDEAGSLWEVFELIKVEDEGHPPEVGIQLVQRRLAIGCLKEMVVFLAVLALFSSAWIGAVLSDAASRYRQPVDKNNVEARGE